MSDAARCHAISVSDLGVDLEGGNGEGDRFIFFNDLSGKDKEELCLHLDRFYEVWSALVNFMLTALILFLLISELKEVYQTQASNALELQGHPITPSRCGDFLRLLTMRGLLLERQGEARRLYYSLSPEGTTLAKQVMG